MGRIIFQLGTNNWQRCGEFAPGSGILHEAHHNSLFELPDTKSYSVYPSKTQRFEVRLGHRGATASRPRATALRHRHLSAATPLAPPPPPSQEEYVRVFPLEHDIPICESISPVSSYRWHGMSEAKFDAYRTRLTDFCESFINDIEAKDGPVTHAIAHHSFLNPIVICDVNKRCVITTFTPRDHDLHSSIRLSSAP